jgi:hypothetical protein
MEDVRRGAGLSAETEAAFKTMWATERDDGAWGRTHADLEPWEVPESDYFGVALAAVATGVAPDGYQKRPDIQANITSLKAYLRDKREGQAAGQPARFGMGRFAPRRARFRERASRRHRRGVGKAERRRRLDAGFTGTLARPAEGPARRTRLERLRHRMGRIHAAHVRRQGG